MQFRIRSISLTELVRSTAVRLGSSASPVRMEVRATGEVLVQADEVRLAQALDNLVDNAVRHGAAPVTVTVQERGGRAEVEVADSGPGVPDDVASRLFERYATAGPTSGTGLGLYLVREIVSHHGGEVAYAPPGAGNPTTFTIALDVDADHSR